MALFSWTMPFLDIDPMSEAKNSIGWLVSLLCILTVTVWQSYCHLHENDEEGKLSQKHISEKLGRFFLAMELYFRPTEGKGFLEYFFKEGYCPRHWASSNARPMHSLLEEHTSTVSKLKGGKLHILTCYKSFHA